MDLQMPAWKEAAWSGQFLSSLIHRYDRENVQYSVSCQSEL